MEWVKIIILIVFCMIGVILIIRSYFPIIRDILTTRKNTRQNDSNNVKDKVEQELAILQSSSDSVKKASAFVSLMSLSYVLVHTLINKGNSYDDQIQSAKFKKSLTPEMIKRLNSLEGKYE